MTSKRVKDWLVDARRLLNSEGGGFEIQLSTQLLLANVINKPRPWLIAHPDAPLTDGQVSEADRLLARLQAGEPLPYLLGRWEFFGLDFEVSPAVLIPRPETEVLVEQAIAWLKDQPGRRSAADVGTGSGCIPVSIARHIPDVHFITVDRSVDALEIAQRNATRLGVADQIQFKVSDLLFDVTGPFDLVCANLPYIPHNDLQSLDVARYEPHLALDGGLDGLDSIRRLIIDAPRWLSPGGLMLLEIQFDQGESVSALARSVLPTAQIQVIEDLAGLPRIVRIENT